MLYTPGLIYYITGNLYLIWRHFYQDCRLLLCFVLMYHIYLINLFVMNIEVISRFFSNSFFATINIFSMKKQYYTYNLHSCIFNEKHRKHAGHYITEMQWTIFKNMLKEL